MCDLTRMKEIWSDTTCLINLSFCYRETLFLQTPVSANQMLRSISPFSLFSLPLSFFYVVGSVPLWNSEFFSEFFSPHIAFYLLFITPVLREHLRDCVMQLNRVLFDIM